MSKKKKRNRVSESASAQVRPMAPVEGVIAPTLVDHVLNANDGVFVAKMHLERPEVVFLAVSALFQQFSAEDAISGGFVLPSEVVLDYLEYSTRALGMPDVASLVKQNFPAALMMFEETFYSLDEASIRRICANAKGMNLLMV